MSNLSTPSERASLDDIVERVERVVRAGIATAAPRGAPPHLRDAMAHAVLSGGGRLRPALCLSVACAHGDPKPEVADAMAAAVEMIHCASLVHDDLPCFDDAELRRGKPTVHRLFGAATAVLAGDALIVYAFELLAVAGDTRGARELAGATGAVRGIIAGQAWESEAAVPLDAYHRAKTAALFGAAAAMGALGAAAEVDVDAWRAWGENVGLAYQAADDLMDVLGEAYSGKTAGRDEARNRPSLVRAHGVEAARRRIRTLLERADETLPPCTDAAPVRAWLSRFGARLAELDRASGAKGGRS